jgi:hypothetical protein
LLPPKCFFSDRLSFEEFGKITPLPTLNPLLPLPGAVDVGEPALLLGANGSTP